MRDINVLISNGTCYYDHGRQSSANIIPCGNAAFGVYACCQEGDVCLDQSICYFSDQRTTYMAGCTDPEYSDSSCPHKDNSGQQLLGLVQCSGSQVGGTALWSACPGPTTKTALGAPSQCSCSGTAAGLLWMTTSLSALATLPAAAGGTIQFNDGHYPTVKTTSALITTTGTSSSSSSSSSTVSPGPSTTNGSPKPAAPAAAHPASANSTTGGLSTGAEVGIGIGATLMGLCATGLAIFTILVYRRKASSSQKGKVPSLVTAENGGRVPITNNSSNGNEHDGASSNIQQHHHHHHHHDASSPGSLHNSRDDGAAWHAYTGYKSELPADPQRHSYRAELPADDIITSSSPPAPTPPSTTWTRQPHTRAVTELVSPPPLSPGGCNERTGRSSSSSSSSPPRPVSEMSSHPGLSSASRGSPRLWQVAGGAGWDEGGVCGGLVASAQDRMADGGGGGALEPISELHG